MRIKKSAYLIKNSHQNQIIIVAEKSLINKYRQKLQESITQILPGLQLRFYKSIGKLLVLKTQSMYKPKMSLTEKAIVEIDQLLAMSQ